MVDLRHFRAPDKVFARRGRDGVHDDRSKTKRSVRVGSRSDHLRKRHPFSLRAAREARLSLTGRARPRPHRTSSASAPVLLGRAPAPGLVGQTRASDACHPRALRTARQVGREPQVDRCLLCSHVCSNPLKRCYWNDSKKAAENAGAKPVRSRRPNSPDPLLQVAPPPPSRAIAALPRDALAARPLGRRPLRCSPAVAAPASCHRQPDPGWSCSSPAKDPQGSGSARACQACSVTAVRVRFSLPTLGLHGAQTGHWRVLIPTVSPRAYA